MVIQRKQKKRRDGVLPYRLACPPLTQYVVGSRTGRFIPKTIIKLVKTPPCLARMRQDRRLTVLPDFLVVCGIFYWDMPFKDLLRSIARVGYRILVPDFYIVLHGI